MTDFSFECAGLGGEVSAADLAVLSEEIKPGIDGRLAGFAGAVVALSFVSLDEMRALNFKYRGIDEPTDVLSFPLWEENGEFRPDKSWDVLALGDVVVAPDVVRRNAEEEKISYNYETARVIIHGALHLAGFGHETEARAEEMFGLQEKILERYAARANIQGGLTAE